MLRAMAQYETTRAIVHGVSTHGARDGAIRDDARDRPWREHTWCARWRNTRRRARAVVGASRARVDAIGDDGRDVTRGRRENRANARRGRLESPRSRSRARRREGREKRETMSCARADALSARSTLGRSRRGMGARGRASVRARAGARSRANALVTTSEYKVAVLGAAGGIGQSLSLLLKMNPLISDLRLYDLANTPGVAADLSHTNTGCKVTGFMGADQLEDALKGCDLVVIPAGVPRKPGMTRDDLFAINAGIVRDLCQACTKACPNALINIISNPVNSTVPIATEVFKKAGCYDARKIFGVTTLDIVRSNTFVAEAKGLDINDVDVPVIGGHAGITILPLLSQTYPKCEFTSDEIEKLTVRIQNAGTEVVEAKAGAGSATLSMAYAAARMAEACLRGLSGEPDVYECTYVASNVTELPFFATKVRLGPNGAEEVLPIGDISAYEADWLAKLKVELTGSIEKGMAFVNN